MDSNISVTLPCREWGFFVIITVERKKFRPMNKYVKVAGKVLLGYVVYNHFKNDIRHELRGRKVGGKCGFRTSMPMQGIPNNGGL